ncbi:MAG: thioredoxin family protein [Planctomycetota bacterium]
MMSQLRSLIMDRRAATVGVLFLVVIIVLAMRAGVSRATSETVLQDIAFDAALATNTTDGKVLVVKATASWCGPCKEMDRTTWVDANVHTWFDANGTAITVDVDDEAETAARLRVQAMPTMIAFRSGQEVDRAVGYMDGRELLRWLDGVVE